MIDIRVGRKCERLITKVSDSFNDKFFLTAKFEFRSTPQSKSRLW